MFIAAWIVGCSGVANRIGNEVQSPEVEDATVGHVSKQKAPAKEKQEVQSNSSYETEDVTPAKSEHDPLDGFQVLIVASKQAEFIAHEIEDGSVFVAVDNCINSEEDTNSNLRFALIEDNSITEMQKFQNGLPKMGYTILRGKKAAIFKACMEMTRGMVASTGNCRQSISVRPSAYRYLSKVISNTSNSLFAIVTYDTGVTGDSGDSGKMTELYRWKKKQWVRVMGTKRINDFYSHVRPFGSGVLIVETDAAEHCGVETQGGNRFVAYGVSKLVVPKLRKDLENIVDLLTFETGEVIVGGHNADGHFALERFASGQKQGVLQIFSKEEWVRLEEIEVIALSPIEIVVRAVANPKTNETRLRFDSNTWSESSLNSDEDRAGLVAQALEKATKKQDQDDRSYRVFSLGSHIFVESVCFDNEERKCLYRDAPVKKRIDLSGECRRVALPVVKEKAGMQKNKSTCPDEDPWG